MLKKIIKILGLAIFAIILTLIVIFVFNPANLRTKIIGGIINSYLNSAVDENSPATSATNKPTDTTQTSTTYDHPLLNADQEKTLENLGVDVSTLPTTISPAMEKCFYEKLGQDRAKEIVDGATPGPMDIFKAKDCLKY
jgi:hypothetical protein